VRRAAPRTCPTFRPHEDFAAGVFDIVAGALLLALVATGKRWSVSGSGRGHGVAISRRVVSGRGVAAQSPAVPPTKGLVAVSLDIAAGALFLDELFVAQVGLDECTGSSTCARTMAQRSAASSTGSALVFPPKIQESLTQGFALLEPWTLLLVLSYLSKWTLAKGWALALCDRRHDAAVFSRMRVVDPDVSRASVVFQGIPGYTSKARRHRCPCDA
jgi:hypothetical protein